MIRVVAGFVLGILFAFVTSKIGAHVPAIKNAPVAPHVTPLSAHGSEQVTTRIDSYLRHQVNPYDFAATAYDLCGDYYEIAFSMMDGSENVDEQFFADAIQRIRKCEEIRQRFIDRLISTLYGMER